MAQFRWPQIFLRNLRVFGHYDTNYPRHWSFLLFDWQIPLPASTSWIFPVSRGFSPRTWIGKNRLPLSIETRKVFRHFLNWITSNIFDSTLSHSKENSVRKSRVISRAKTRNYEKLQRLKTYKEIYDYSVTRDNLSKTSVDEFSTCYVINL